MAGAGRHNSDLLRLAEAGSPEISVEVDNYPVFLDFPWNSC